VLVLAVVVVVGKAKAVPNEDAVLIGSEVIKARAGKVAPQKIAMDIPRASILFGKK